MDDSIFAANFVQRPFWWEAAPPTSTAPDIPQTAAVVIIGGLMTATLLTLTLLPALYRYFAEPDEP